MQTIAEMGGDDMAEKDTVRKEHVIGKSVKRVDAFEKVTGSC